MFKKLTAAVALLVPAAVGAFPVGPIDWLARINAPAAHETATGKGVRVAVVDGGVAGADEEKVFLARQPRSTAMIARARAHLAGGATSNWQIAQPQAVWMSHGDCVMEIGPEFESLARTENCPIAAVRHKTRPVFGVQNLIGNPRIERSSPRRYGRGLKEYPIAWTYQFESVTPLVGLPGIPP
jgi:hypothetical protein